MSKLMRFGLALFGAAASSVIVASSALATYDWEDTGANTTMSLTGHSTSAQVIVTKFGTTECANTEFTGTQTSTTTTTSPEKANTVGVIKVHPAYTGCKVLGFSSTWNTTGCEYEFTTATTTTGGPTAHAVVHIKGCTIHIIAAGGLCSIDIPAQENIGLAEFTDEGTGAGRHVKLTTSTANSNEIEYEGVGGLCSGKGVGGTTTGTIDFTAKSGNEAVGFWVT
jgi:hypothetical protein